MTDSIAADSRVWTAHGTPPELSGPVTGLPALEPPPDDAQAWLARLEDTQLDGVGVVRNVGVPARDGVRLGTDIYLPARPEGVALDRRPAILERTPYGKHAAGFVVAARALADAGYAVVLQDVRGRYASEGQFYPFGDEGPDGHDAVSWVREQPWCDGQVATMGVSYDACTQMAAAATNPPGLAAQVVAQGPFNYHTGAMRQGGALEQRFYAYTFGMAASSREAHADAGLRAALEEGGRAIGDWLARAPIRPGATPLARIPSYESWVRDLYTHGSYDEYWMRPGYTVEPFLDGHADVPTIFLGSWYDSYAWNTSTSFAELAKRKTGPYKLIMGPWLHGMFDIDVSGDIGFGDHAPLGYASLLKRWFDATLNGEDNGMLDESPVKIFVMGGGSGRRRIDGRLDHGGQWRAENEWPLARTAYTSYFIHSDGTLATEPPAHDSGEQGASTTYRFDPERPVPTVGGCISAAEALMPPGGFDQRASAGVHRSADDLPLAARPDVLVFQTAPLVDDVEVTGHLEVRLYVSSDCPDTDFTAKLIDVYPPSPDYPNGYALNIQDGIQRMRFREDRSREAMMTPGEIYEVTIRLYPTSNLFARNHRIRLDISSSNYPRFDVNPNTGDPLGTHRRHRVAENTVWHSAGRSSHVVLPIVPYQ